MLLFAWVLYFFPLFIGYVFKVIDKWSSSETEKLALPFYHSATLSIPYSPLNTTFKLFHALNSLEKYILT